MLSIWQIVTLAVIQGLAELLPVSSSAHVVVAEKLMRLDPTTPAMTLLLVMLHTGTMFAVIAYFWKRWRGEYFADMAQLRQFVVLVVIATVATGVIGIAATKLLTHFVLAGGGLADTEQLFSHLEIIAPALAAAGILIVLAGVRERRAAGNAPVTPRSAGIVGMVQGLCLPLRGFSRSGSTISTGMLLGVEKAKIETFSFALAVVLTPPVVGRELLRLVKAEKAVGFANLHSALMQGLLGAACAFVAGLVALKWLSVWLERGRWYLFGLYCLLAAGGVEWLYRSGY